MKRQPVKFSAGAAAILWIASFLVGGMAAAVTVFFIKI